MMKLIHTSLLVTILMISGCGFHLRGSHTNLPWLKSVAIINNANKNIKPIIIEELKNNNVDVTDNIEKSNYWLIIESDSFEEKILSISSSTTPRQYQLIYTVIFKLQKTNGEEVISPGKIIITRVVTINSNRILGSNDEVDHFKNEMIKDSVIQILYRLSRGAISVTH